MFKWEKRNRLSDPYFPFLRSGCTDGSLGCEGGGLLEGVADGDTNEEGLQAMFSNDLYVCSVGAPRLS